jgi:phage FluMu protein gp41
MSVKGTLKHGFTIGGIAYTGFELRPVTVADMLDTEDSVTAEKPMQWNAHLLARQLVRVWAADGKTFEGPFVYGQIRALSPADFRILSRAQRQLDAMGEPEPEPAEGS